MTESISFRTRARTIDHLGREQIADVPTAISELWKNAYDAYATKVATHLYAGEAAVASILDDGHGMSRSDFINKWLVVGTESKVAGVTPEKDRKGLPRRPRQGQKGIGRLSVAALGSAVLVLSKAEDAEFVAALLDWRLFENPFLLLQDIEIPVADFKEPQQLESILGNLKEGLLENVAPSVPLDPPLGVEADGKKVYTEQQKKARRVVDAWSAFDALEIEADSYRETTSSRIRALISEGFSDTKVLNDWSVWPGQSPSGTALIISDLNSFLESIATSTGMTVRDEDEAARISLRRALTGFSDPYSEAQETLDYRVVLHSTTVTNIVQREEEFGIEFLRSLEHFFEGEVDGNGVFRGRVKAFGKWLGDVEFIPKEPPPLSSREHIGPFKICLGTFEQELRYTTVPEELHRRFSERAETHSGLNIYRDGLRVMPYGRPENDFFSIEERRGRHAGREFWASRRLFGRIAITRAGNPNLRDKAGREGLIDNAASRAIQRLVIDLLQTFARRYYGTDSPVRQELLPGIEAENLAAAEKAREASKRTLRNFRSELKHRLPLLESAVSSVKRLIDEVESAIQQNDAVALYNLASKVEEIDNERISLKLPPRPKKLGNFESNYRAYRDTYSAFASDVLDVRRKFTDHAQMLEAIPPMEVARSHFGRGQKAVTDRLAQWRRRMEASLNSELERMDQQVSDDQKEFYKVAAPLLKELEEGQISLGTAMSEMDEVKESLISRFSNVYDPYIRALDQLAEGIDLDSALSYAEARQVTLETRLARIQSLAQIGISVEILSHELQTLNRRLESSLDSLPKEVKTSRAMQSADQARRELVERLRFLSELQITEGDVRKRIEGREIEEYLRSFFQRILEDKYIRLEATPRFRECSFYEYPSRIYPVFINLVNNSTYWLSSAPERRILLDAGNGTLIISDTGPGVDRDDEESLFELFFTRRLRGRGVGLYLSRQTLSAGGHTIRYINDDREKTLPGANFEIKLRDGFDG